MMVGLLRQQRDHRHESERLDEVVELDLAMQLAVSDDPTFRE
jgi:hypothetical protein